MLRQEIVDEARVYVKARTAWRHMGRTIKAVDCVGLLAMVARKFDIPYREVPDNYRREPQGESLVHMLRSQMAVCEQKPALGRVVLIHDQRLPCHVGIIGERHGEWTIIHSDLAVRRVHEELLDHHYRSRVRGYLDFPGLED